MENDNFGDWLGVKIDDFGATGQACHKYVLRLYIMMDEPVQMYMA